MKAKEFLFKQDAYGCDVPTTVGKVVIWLLLAVVFGIASYATSRLIEFIMVLCS